MRNIQKIDRCPFCNNTLNDTHTLICPFCNTILRTPTRNDMPTARYFILGMLIPIVGIIIFATKKDTLPRMAKSAITGAIISIVLASILLGGFFVFYYAYYLPSLFAGIL